MFGIKLIRNEELYRSKIEQDLRRRLFEDQSPGDWKANCKPVFMDSNGLQYYRYVDEMQVPLARFRELQIKIQEIHSTVKSRDLLQWLQETQKIVTGRKKDSEKVKEVNSALHVLSERLKLSFPPSDLLMELVCILYIAEDQNPAVFDIERERVKFKQLNKDKRGGLADFFSHLGLWRYLPSLPASFKITEEHLKMQDTMAAAFRKVLS